MRKLYLIDTEEYRFLMSDDGNVRRILTDDKEPKMLTNETKKYLENIEDDSSWKIYQQTAEELIGDGIVIAELEVEW